MPLFDHSWLRQREESEPVEEHRERVLRAELRREVTRARDAYKKQKQAEERVENLYEVALGLHVLVCEFFVATPREEWPEDALERFKTLTEDRVRLGPDN